MPQYPFPTDIPRAATAQETQDFLRNLLSMSQLREAAMAPPAPAPTAPPAPQGLGGLVGLAKATGRGIENNQAPEAGAGGFGVLGSGAQPKAPNVIWNKDRSQWRYPASNTWYPASQTPK